jgi:hypothetical protein
MKTKPLALLHAALVAALLASQPLTATAQSSSPSELLEKGIYAEETKGDIDVAMTIYQQLIGEAKANLSLAAQAQFRLAQCLLKKNRTNEATAAFEKLIHDFPGEKELIAKAREHLPSEMALRPIPWVDGERLQLNLTLPTGLDVGTLELRSDLVDSGGQKVWRIGRRMSGGTQMLSSVDVDAVDFHPLASYWKIGIIGTASGLFKPGEVEVRREGEGDADAKKIPTDRTVYDNEQAMHMLRLLPLEVGYKTTIPVITTLGGGTILPIGIEVPKKETVETPAGKFDCYQVVMNVGQTFWISDDEHRYLVKFDAGGAFAHLASITQRKAGSPVPFRDDMLGVLFTAPPDWVIHAQGKGDKETVIHLLDPGANSDHIGIHLRSTESLAAAVRQSARALADMDVRDNLAKSLKDLKVRPNAWKNYTVSGRPGVALVGDYTESGKAKVIFSLYAIGPKTCENFVLSCPPELFDDFLRTLEQIIASYRMK